MVEIAADRCQYGVGNQAGNHGDSGVKVMPGRFCGGIAAESFETVITNCCHDNFKNQRFGGDVGITAEHVGEEQADCRSQ